MVQPYLHAVETAAETSLLFFGGAYSHGARKGPVLDGTSALSPGAVDIGPRQPSPAERAVAEQVLAAIGEPVLYARVDLLPGPDGPLLLELELTEPYLFLGMADGAQLEVQPTGKAVLRVSCQTQGQGHETTFAQLVAAELGIAPADVEVVHGDTDNTPYGLGTYASRSTPVAGAATTVIARKLRDKGREIAAHLL